MIQLTSTNMTDRINFITDRGDKGLLQLLVSTDQLLIDGIPQHDIFQYS